MDRIHTYDENKVVFHNYDTYVSKVQGCHMTSVASLIEYFKGPIIEEDYRELFLVRAFFIWLAEMKANPVGGLPNEIEFLLQDDNVLSFASLCKSADIQHQIVNGISKDLGYIPGQDENDESIIRTSWIIVKSVDRWHIIDPDRGMYTVAGYRRGGEIQLENEGKTELTDEKGTEGICFIQVNDFWFCLSPNIFITYSFPDDPKCQLLPSKKHMSKYEYLSLPYLEPGFFVARLQLLSEQTSVLHSSHGKCTISYGANKKESRYITMSYRLSLRKGTGDLSGVNVADLPLLVVYAPGIDTFSFNIRFPVAAEYIFETYVSSLDTKGDMLDSCTMFKIVCTDPDPNCKKLPLHTGSTGYGFGYTAIDFGLKNPSTTFPNVPIKCSRNDEDASELTFQIDSDKVDEVEFFSEIVGDKNQNNGEKELQLRRRKKELTLDYKMQQREVQKNVLSTNINEIELEIENLKIKCDTNSTISKTDETGQRTSASVIKSEVGDESFTNKEVKQSNACVLL